MTVPIATPRQALRTRLAARRQALAAPERVAAARGLRDSLERLPEFLVDQRVGGYWASGGELPLNLAMASFTERGQRLYLPVIDTQRNMCFAPWHRGDPIEPNRYGIPEPTTRNGTLAAHQLELVLVPLLGFDRAGNRLGFGGGYYDRAFAFLHAEPRPAVPLLVGIGYAFQELDSIETRPWDVPLDYIATESELIDCTEGNGIP